MCNTKHIFHLLAMTMLLVVAACTSEDDFQVQQPGNSAGQTTCRMVLNATVAGYGSATRAGDVHEWKDGDLLYIRFASGSDVVTGAAVYSSAGDDWTLDCSGTLATGKGQKCEIYYFENATPTGNTSVNLTVHSAIYECSDGSYIYNGKELYVAGTLLPKTGRVRFVAGGEQSLTVGGISHYTSFDLGSKEYTSSSAPMTLSTTLQGEECSTGYVYGFYADATERQIRLRSLDTIYSRIFPLSMLNAGQSGYIAVPTEENDEGWEIPTFSGTLNGHEYVDLGLPSGTLWATCNVGATTPEEYGNYYAWGETETKSDYNRDNCVTYGKDMYNISGSAQYDAARVEWGGTWSMPDRFQLNELCNKNNCTWEWITQNGVNGYKVTGKNCNSIFLPAAGRSVGTSLNDLGTKAYYWSSSPYEGFSIYADAYYLCFYSGYHSTTHYDVRYYGFSVRPVSK